MTNTAAAQTIPANLANLLPFRSRFFTANIIEIAALPVTQPWFGEVDDVTRPELLRLVAKEFRKLMLPAKGSDFDAVAAWVCSNPFAA